MKSGGKVTIQVLIVSLIGLASAVGTLLLLSQGASARPMLNPVTVSIPKSRIADPTDGDTDLAVSKSDDTDPVIAGERLTYYIQVSNNGLITATNIVLTDTLPSSGVTFVSSTPGDPTCKEEPSGVVICNLGSLTHGTLGMTTTMVTICVDVDPSRTEKLVNHAEVSADEYDPNTDTETTQVNVEADLVVTKTDDPEPVTAGNVLTYEVTVTNNGPSNASGVTLTDTLPSGVTFVSSTPGEPTCVESSGVVICNLSDINSGHHKQVTIVVTVDSSTTGLISNRATVSGNETDPNSSNDTVSENTDVNAEVNLTIAKTGAPDPVNAGGNLTYEIVFTNTGPSDATSVVVTDTLDPNLDYASALPLPTQFDNGNPYWSFARLEPGASGQITVDAQVHTPLPNNTILTNTASIDCGQDIPLSVQESTIVHSGPLLTITKTDNPDPVDAGGALRYTLTIANSGNENATSVTVTEHYDPNTSFFFSGPDPDPGSENKVWTFPTLAVGNPETIDIVVMVTSPLPAGTVLTNQATLDSNQTTPITITEVTSVTTTSELTVSKFDSLDPVSVGGELKYFIRYHNAGTAPAEDVVITEMYDRQVTFVSADPPPRSGTDNVWDFANLPVNTGGDIEVKVRVNSPLPDGTTLANRVTIDSAHTSPQNYTEFTSVSSPDLAIAAVHEPSLFSPGKLMTYTVSYSNTGSLDAKNVVITTTLPLDTIYVGQGWTSSDGQTYITVTGDLPSGASGQAYFVVQYPKYPDQPQQIGAAEFNTPFTISESSSNRDGNLDDNTACVHIGVPDLIVTGFTVEPSSPEAGQPVTFTVVVKNQGTGMAWNPDVEAGFWVDVFIAPVASYPFERDGDCWKAAPPIEPGLQHTLTITHSGFGEAIETFYAKVDNHGLYPYGLVPEYDEMNNLFDPWSYYVYLPLVFR